jgi:predicted transposase YbfD/YdcC
LAHLCVEYKENEIPAFHEFLLSLNLKDCVVTADTMHFQKNFETAAEQGIGLLIQLKGNHEEFYNQVAHGCGRFKLLACEEDPWEKGHGHI